MKGSIDQPKNCEFPFVRSKGVSVCCQSKYKAGSKTDLCKQTISSLEKTENGERCAPNHKFFWMNIFWITSVLSSFIWNHIWMLQNYFFLSIQTLRKQSLILFLMQFVHGFCLCNIFNSEINDFNSATRWVFLVQC